MSRSASPPPLPPPASATQPEPDTEVADFDASLDVDLDVGMSGTTAGDGAASQLPGTSQTAGAGGQLNATEDLPPAMPPPSRKDTTLREFLSRMDDYAPIVSLRSIFVSYAYYLL